MTDFSRPFPEPVWAGHSPDRRWWWDGRSWWAAMTPNRRFWFNGREWVRWRNGRPSRGGLSTRGAIWLLLCTAWLPTDTVLLNAHDSNPTAVSMVIAVIVTGLGLLALPAGGLVLARDREPWRFRFLWLVGTAANLVGYVAAMLTFPDQPGQDNAAGAGLAVFFVPIAVVVAALIAIGMGIGTLFYRRRQTH